MDSRPTFGEQTMNQPIATSGRRARPHPRVGPNPRGMDTMETQVFASRKHRIRVVVHPHGGHDMLALSGTDTVTHGTLRG